MLFLVFLPSQKAPGLLLSLSFRSFSSLANDWGYGTADVSFPFHLSLLSSFRSPFYHHAPLLYLYFIIPPGWAWLHMMAETHQTFGRSEGSTVQTAFPWLPQACSFSCSHCSLCPQLLPALCLRTYSTLCLLHCEMPAGVISAGTATPQCHHSQRRKKILPPALHSQVKTFWLCSHPMHIYYPSEGFAYKVEEIGA
jgi:hypothetical protein